MSFTLSIYSKTGHTHTRAIKKDDDDERERGENEYYDSQQHQRVVGAILLWRGHAEREERERERRRAFSFYTKAKREKVFCAYKNNEFPVVRGRDDDDDDARERGAAHAQNDDEGCVVVKSREDDVRRRVEGRRPRRDVCIIIIIIIIWRKEEKASENDGDSLRMVRVHGAVNILQQNLDARWEQVSIANISDVYAHVRGVRVLRDRAEF